MKFPRNARIFRGRLDVAPFAVVFFLMAMFLLLASLVYTPGVLLELPVGNDLPGTESPPIAVAIDSHGRLYFENQWIEEDALKARLKHAVETSPEPLVLVVQADKAVTYAQLIHLTLLARDAGIQKALLATLARPTSLPTGLSVP